MSHHSSRMFCTSVYQKYVFSEGETCCYHTHWCPVKTEALFSIAYTIKININTIFPFNNNRIKFIQFFAVIHKGTRFSNASTYPYIYDYLSCSGICSFNKWFLYFILIPKILFSSLKKDYKIIEYSDPTSLRSY